MVKKTRPDTDGAILDAAMRLFAERGYAGVRMADIAEAAACDATALRSRAGSSKVELLAFLRRRIDARVLGENAGDYGPQESVRDRLFDMLMRRFDTLRPYRDAVRAVARDLVRDPAALVSGAPSAMSAFAWYLEEAGTSADGFLGALRVKGLAAVWLHCLRVFLNDDSEDLARTMAALDRDLARAERVAGWCRGVGRRTVPPEDDAPDPSAA